MKFQLIPYFRERSAVLRNSATLVNLIIVKNAIKFKLIRDFPEDSATLRNASSLKILITAKNRIEVKRIRDFKRFKYTVQYLLRVRYRCVEDFEDYYFIRMRLY